MHAFALVLLFSLLGGLLLVGGLYSVLWGKSREHKANDVNNLIPEKVDSECSELKEVVTSKSAPPVPLVVQH